MAEQKDLMQIITDFFADLLRGGANQANITPISQVVADAGYTQEELAQVDLNKAYTNACNYPGVPAECKVPLPTSNPTPEQVVRHITQVTEVHNTNQQVFNVTDNSQNVDNSVDFDGDVQVDGDFSFDQDNVSATGGSVAGGQNAVGATGDGSAASGAGDAAASGGLVNSGTNLGNLNTGDRASQIGGTSLDLGFGRGAVEPVRLESLDPAGRVITPEHPDLPDFPPGPGGVHGNIVVNTGDVGGDNTQVGEDFHDESQTAETHGDFSPVQQEQDSGDAQQLDDPAELTQS
ncbi:MAG TPA: hypothetical protein VF462_16035 [Micromonosporaceae bacterium]